MVNSDDTRGFLAQHDCLHDAAAIDRALARMATAIDDRLGGRHPLALCVLHGGLIFAGHLLTRLSFSVETDYIHATRYRGSTTGKELHWLAMPRTPMAGRTVLLLDDIFDEGFTLKALYDHCMEQGAERVYTAVLAVKNHPRVKADYTPDFVGLEVEDRYVFGFGMDYKHRWRNAHGIYAIRDDA